MGKVYTGICAACGYGLTRCQCNENRRELLNKAEAVNAFPDHVAVEPEYIVNADGSIKFTGFWLVRKE